MKADVTYLARITMKNVKLPDNVDEVDEKAILEYMEDNAINIVDEHKDIIQYALEPISPLQAYTIYDENENIIAEEDFEWE